MLVVLLVLGLAGVLVLPSLRSDPAPAGPYGASGALPGLTYPDLPFPAATSTDGAPAGDAGPSAGDGSGIPATVLAAYHRAEGELATRTPGCHLPWSIIAGIGKVETDHARGGAVDAGGTTLAPILGPVLNGTDHTAAIFDTDHGRLDTDPVWDRAVGPTQFLPATWAIYGTAVAHSPDPAAPVVDGQTPDINNVYDAATATGRYLCAGGRDLATARDVHDAVFAYNHSEDYVAHVLAWARAYATGATTLPDSGTDTPDTSGRAGGGSGGVDATPSLATPSLATSVGVPVITTLTAPAPPDPLVAAAPAGPLPAETNPPAPGPGQAPTAAPPAASTGAPGPGLGPAGTVATATASIPSTLTGAAPPHPSPASTGAPGPPIAMPSPPPNTPPTPAPTTAPTPRTTASTPGAAAPTMAPTVAPGWCATHLPASVISAAAHTPVSTMRVLAHADGPTLTCSAVTPSGPLVLAAATAYPDPAAAHTAALASSGAPRAATWSSPRAQLIVVDGSVLVRLTVPTTTATTALSPLAASATLNTITTTWPH